MKIIKLTGLIFLSCALTFSPLNSALAVTNWTVTVTNFAFIPKVLTIGQGDSVTWTNRAINAHTSSSGDTNACTASGLWANTIVASGSFTRTFNDAPGTYTYICTVPGHCSIDGM